MARLNCPADAAHAPPTADRSSNAVAVSEIAMPSSAFHPLTSGAGLQSHGTDNLPPSPPCKGSGRSSFSPVDCRNLEKLLRNTNVSFCLETPQDPSPSEPGAHLFPDMPPGSGVSGNTQKDSKSYETIGGEMTDTGYEDEDDSMELSDDAEGLITESTLAPFPFENPTLLSFSKSDRHLQDSVSMHEKDHLRYTGRRSWTANPSKPKKPDRSDNRVNTVTNGDTIEDVLSLLGKRSSPTYPLDLGLKDSERQPVGNDSKQLNQVRLSLEKVLGDERVHRTEHEEESGIAIVTPNTAKEKAKGSDDSDFEGFDADEENTTVEMSKVRCRKNSQSKAAKLGQYTTFGVDSAQNGEGTQLLVPNTPIATPNYPSRAQIEAINNQNVPETPFAKTLSYYKQMKGIENTPSKRRRNTALPSEISELAEVAVDGQVKTSPSHPEELPHRIMETDRQPATSALTDLESMVHDGRDQDMANQDMANLAHFTIAREDPRQTNTPMGAAPETVGDKVAYKESAGDETEKQLILFPQHPAFVTAIGMIPATMFWATAAPVVKYSSMAVELLIDKLRDTYL